MFGDKPSKCSVCGCKYNNANGPHDMCKMHEAEHAHVKPLVKSPARFLGFRLKQLLDFVTVVSLDNKRFTSNDIPDSFKYYFHVPDRKFEELETPSPLLLIYPVQLAFQLGVVVEECKTINYEWTSEMNGWFALIEDMKAAAALYTEYKKTRPIYNAVENVGVHEKRGIRDIWDVMKGPSYPGDNLGSITDQLLTKINELYDRVTDDLPLL